MVEMHCQTRAQAQARGPEALSEGLGLGLGDLKPKPAQAGPWTSSWEGGLIRT
jgi:hypothetical protein